MKIVIIEDEELTADDLADTIRKIEPAAQICAMLYSVNEAISYLTKNEKPDLIFSDIQLGDGLCFEIFKAVPISTPVIFCTAYDEYALKAFKANGIDYVLKPFTKKIISQALRKYKELKINFSRNNTDYDSLAGLLERSREPQDMAVLVYFKDKILPIKTIDIALFYVENQVTHLITFDQKTYHISKTLEELEKITGNSFYRANRKTLINRKAIKDASQYFQRKLLINLTISFTAREPITVGKLKVVDFLNWLSGH